MNWVSVFSGAFIGLGLVFFISGSVGLLRFPDLFSRLHAVTKADTVGLGLVVGGLALQAESVRAALLLVLIWLVVMASGAVTCHLLARFSLPEVDA
jgi:multicomponent Na+:H+ antiporter subunit G